VAGLDRLIRGGVYLTRLDPAKGAEVGKLRPVVVLTDQFLLDVSPPHVFVCPLNGRSDPDYQALHLSLPARDNLKVQVTQWSNTVVQFRSDACNQIVWQSWKLKN